MPQGWVDVQGHGGATDDRQLPTCATFCIVTAVMVARILLPWDIVDQTFLDTTECRAT